MIKPKYPKRSDLSQVARLIVEHATGVPLTPEPTKVEVVPQEAYNHHKKHSQATKKADK